MSVTKEDLRLSLDDFMYSKKTTAPTTTDDILDQLRKMQISASKQEDPLAEQSASPPKQTARVTTTSTATATAASTAKAGAAVVRPATGTRLKANVSSQQDAAPAVAKPKRVRPGGGFGKLSMEFLSGVQKGLESLGYDLTRADVMQQILSDPTLPAQLLNLMTNTMGGVSTEELKEMIRQWGVAVAEQQRQEAEAKTKKQRPIWKCAVCGRYGCPVAPYIEGYEEFED